MDIGTGRRGNKGRVTIARHAHDPLSAFSRAEAEAAAQIAAREAAQSEKNRSNAEMARAASAITVASSGD